MKLYVTNMVCDRCKMVVRAELERSGLHPVSVALGEADITEDLSRADLHEINHNLHKLGFSIIDDHRSRVVEKAKNLITELIYSKNNDLTTTLSQYLAFSIGRDYSSISHWFSTQEGTTVEQYYVLQKIERVKELLAYDDLNLNEISDLLHYSSASHLSKQFKKVTGLTPSSFRITGQPRRRSLNTL